MKVNELKLASLISFISADITFLLIYFIGGSIRTLLITGFLAIMTQIAYVHADD